MKGNSGFRDRSGLFWHTAKENGYIYIGRLQNTFGNYGYVAVSDNSQLRKAQQTNRNAREFQPEKRVCFAELGFDKKDSLKNV